MTDLHIRGDLKCPTCCCHGSIHKNCGGIFHERVVDDCPEDGWIHNYRCDKCNYEAYSYGYEDKTIEFKEIGELKE